MKVVVNDISYKSKKQLKEHVTKVMKEMVSKKTYIISKGNEYFSLWSCLFARHPTKNHIIPTSFVFERPHHMHYCVDGKKQSFSYNKCITQKIPKKLTEIVEAMRACIIPQIEEFKKTTVNKCNTCNIVLEYYEVDHIVDFKIIYNNFIETIELEEDEVIIKYNSNMHRTCFVLTDDYTNDLCNLWCDFHKEHATLQKLCKNCHNNKTKLK